MHICTKPRSRSLKPWRGKADHMLSDMSIVKIVVKIWCNNELESTIGTQHSCMRKHIVKTINIMYHFCMYRIPIIWVRTI
jgi:hypothetical protein